MTVFDPALDNALKRLTAQLRDRFPEIAEELDGLAEEPEVGPVVARLMRMVKDRPDMAAEILKLAQGCLEGVREPLPPEPQEMVRSYGDALGVTIKPEDLLFRAPKSRLPQLDPNVEAAIAERAQFDGDVPELRSGRLPEGARPAIPVKTTARNPVAVGRMLRQASEDVAEEIRQLEFDHEQTLLAAGAEIDEHGNVKNLPATFEGAPLAKIRAPDPETYPRGHRPQPIAVRAPTAVELSALSKTDEQVAAYEALATTQGRRSAVDVIRDLVLADLRRHGLDVGVNEKPDRSRRDVPVCVEWATTLAEGPNSTQPRFSFIDIAATVLAKKLRDKLSEVSLVRPVLEVIPINTVDVRRVGWAARIVEHV